MPLYKWNEVKERRGQPEEVHKQREFPTALEYRASDTSRDHARSQDVDRGVFERMKQQAHSDAEDIVSRARTDAEQIRAKAYTEAKAAAEAELQAKFKDSLEKSFAAVREALDQRQKIIKTAEPEILKLATKIAMQIIHSEITLNRDVIMNVVSDAINKITDREQVIIKVNQADIERVKDHKEDIEDMLDGAKNLSIVADKKVEAGGCLIETKVGLVDARVSTKVEALEKAFMKVYEDDARKQEIAEESDHRRVDEKEHPPTDKGVFAAEEEESEEVESSDTDEAEDTDEVKDSNEFDFESDDLDLDLDFGEDEK